jgi:hypothetical protein
VLGSNKTPTPSSGLRGFWERRSKWGKAGLITGPAVVVALIAIGLAVPAFDESENTSAQVTEQADDTGRLNEDEFAWFVLFLGTLDREIDQLETALPGCAVLFRASRLAAASECVEAASFGVGRRASFVNVTVDHFRDDEDAAKRCLEEMNAYQKRLSTLDAYVASLQRAGTNLQGETFIRLGRQATRQTRAYRTARDAALLACEPH